MTDQQTAERPPPMFRLSHIPVVVWATALALLLLYAAFFFAPVGEQQGMLYDFALAPERFWAPAGSEKVYPSYIAGLLTLASTALLHGGWLHVIVNSLMMVQFGIPVSRALGPGIAGAGAWMLLFVVSVVAGSAFYLAMYDVNGPYAVGASGGTSGLIAAAFLIDPYTGRRRSLWSPAFLKLTAAFAAINVLLVLAGPYLVGAAVAWEAHAGGYVAGALLMSILPFRGLSAPQT
ncbi:MAG TPA: rhomboid family intramembrane serine protease [Hyphomonadaceae bacterium]|nr:rhomboid family intramembrane serine protease [Hyphomonadaceae bacterium]